MRHSLLRISTLLFAIVMVTAGFVSQSGLDLSRYLQVDEALCFDVPSEEEYTPVLGQNASLFLGKSYVGFKEAIGFKESRNKYHVVNRFGYMGKYQFGKGTLHMIGVYDTQNFLSDSRIQEAAFDAYAAKNKWILRRDIERFEGRVIGGVQVTESGILAAAHLAGAGNVKKFLRSGGAIAFQDAFGTSIRYYLKKFSGYDTSMVPARKTSKVR